MRAPRSGSCRPRASSSWSTSGTSRPTAGGGLRVNPRSAHRRSLSSWQESVRVTARGARGRPTASAATEPSARTGPAIGAVSGRLPRGRPHCPRDGTAAARAAPPRRPDSSEDRSGAPRRAVSDRKRRPQARSETRSRAAPRTAAPASQPPLRPQRVPRRRTAAPCAPAAPPAAISQQLGELGRGPALRGTLVRSVWAPQCTHAVSPSAARVRAARAGFPVGIT